MWFGVQVAFYPRLGLSILIAGSGLTLALDQLPTRCGTVGVARYRLQVPSTPTPDPVIVLEKGTVVTVTNATDVVNGNVSSPAALLANPGPDGISLREAITATNNLPGTYTIRFDAALKGAVIYIGPNQLPDLVGGNVIINGDGDGDGKPDVKLIEQAGAGNLFGFTVKSGGNTIHALSLNGFYHAVLFGVAAPNRTQAGNTISHLVIRNVVGGITLHPGNDEVPLGNRWVNTLIIGNDIQSTGGGIEFMLHFSSVNSLEHTLISRNVIRGGPAGSGISIGAGYSATGTDNTIVDVVIADNVIDGAWQDGIAVRAGDVGASRNRIDGILIRRNQITMKPNQYWNFGIHAVVGDSGTDDLDSSVQPFTYPEGNEIANLQITDNSITGEGTRGIFLQLGFGGAEHNSIHDVVLLGNVVELGPPTPAGNWMGITLAGAGGVGRGRKPGQSGLMRNVLIQANTVRMSGQRPDNQNGAFQVNGSELGGKGNRLEDIWISHNDLDGGSAVDLNICGGDAPAQLTDPKQEFVSSGNTVSHIEAWCNLAQHSKGIAITGGRYGAVDNRVEGVRLQDNLVAGVLNDVTLQDNFDSDSTGNTVSLAVISPGVPDVNPLGIVSAAIPWNVPVAAGSIVSLYGSNLASSSGEGGLPLPTGTGDTSVRIDGIAAPLFYVSPGQINFQAPWELAGRTVAFVTITAGGITSAAQPLSLAPTGPGLFTTDGTGSGQGAIVISETGQLAASSDKFPGSRPAAHNEFVTLFATGLGGAKNQPASGAGAPLQPLSTSLLTPGVTIGGVPASVSFSGLAPGFVGLYQVNAQVPDAAPAGDSVPVVLSIGGIDSNTVSIAVR